MECDKLKRRRNAGKGKADLENSSTIINTLATARKREAGTRKTTTATILHPAAFKELE